MNRRDFFATTASAALIARASVARAQSQPSEVKIGTIQPLSGPWARPGQIALAGAQLAVDDINASGGIKSLGGAKIKLIVADGGETPDKMKTAAQRLLSDNPDMIGGMGGYVSSFTLAITEITERGELPWIDFAYADLLTGRGFKYVFQTSPTGGQQAEAALPTVVDLIKSTGKPMPTNAAIVMDNTPSPQSFSKGIREGGLAKYGMNLAVDEIFTPPLSDASTIAQRVRAARPGLLIFLPTATSDIKLVLEKLSEVGLNRSRLPVLANGSPMGTSDLLRIAGKDTMESVMFIAADWEQKNTIDIAERFKKKTGEPWMSQDALMNYGHVYILKEALESTASTDKQKINQALHAMDLTTGPAMWFPGKRIKFEESGRIIGAPIVIVQWQGGVPRVVFPLDIATAKLNWGA
jgi:branched-chain amino acid transport system substrate-binding protein